MSRKKPQAFPYTEIGPSRTMAALLIGMHLIAGVATAFSILANYTWAAAFSIGLLVIAWSLRHHLRLHAWRSSPRAIVGLRVNQDGEWKLQQRDGKQFDARLLADSVVHPNLILLRFRTEHGRLSVVLPNDTLPAGRRRGLRVFLLTSPPVVG